MTVHADSLRSTLIGQCACGLSWRASGRCGREGECDSLRSLPSAGIELQRIASDETQRQEGLRLAARRDSVWGKDVACGLGNTESDKVRTAERRGLGRFERRCGNGCMAFDLSRTPGCAA